MVKISKLKIWIDSCTTKHTRFTYTLSQYFKEIGYSYFITARDIGYNYSFLKDVFSLAPLGTHMFIFMCLGLMLSYISKRFLRYNWIFILPLFFVATFGQGVIYALVQNIYFSRELSFCEIPWLSLALELSYGLAIFFIFLKPIKRCVIDKLS